MSTTDRIHVVIVEDFPIVRAAISHALRRDERLEVVGEVEDGRGLLDLLVNNHADVALLDLHMPGLSGAELIQRIRRIHPKLKVLIFSACEKPGQVHAALRAGADGYVVKRQSATEIGDAVAAVARGDRVIAPQLVASVMGSGLGSDAVPTVAELPPFAMRILEGVVRGETDEQLATELFVSPRTVQNHLSTIRRIAGVQRRTELARWACDNALV